MSGDIRGDMREALNMAILMIVTVLGYGLFGILLSKLLYRSWIAPLGIYSFIWSVIPVLYILSVLPWPDLTTEAFVAILLSWIAFATGCVTVSVGPKARPGTRPVVVKEALLRKAIILFGFLGMIGSVFALFKMIRHFGLQAMLQSPAVVQKVFFFSGENPGLFVETVILHAFTMSAGALGGVYWGYFRFRGFLLIPLVAVTIYSFAMIARLHLLIIILLYLSGYLGGLRLAGKPLRVKARHIFFILGGFALIIVFTVFVGKTGLYFLKYDVPIPLLMAEIIHRLNSPIEGLNWTLSQESPIAMGRNLLYPVAEVIYRLSGLNLPSEPFFVRTNPLFPEWGESFRSVSYLGIAYRDFGWLGVLIIPYVLGVIGSLTFRKRSLPCAIVFSFVYTQILQSWSWWHFRLPFFMGAFLFSLVVAILHAELKEVSMPT